MRIKDRRRPHPDSTVTSASERTIAAPQRRGRRERMKVGEADVRGGSVDGVGAEEDGELVTSGETTALGLW